MKFEFQYPFKHLMGSQPFAVIFDGFPVALIVTSESIWLPKP